MTGIDTNVLVRYFAKDDEKQLVRAKVFLTSITKRDPGFISLVVLVELIWVMQRSYGATRQEVADILNTMLRAQELVIENAETVAKALRKFAASNAGFSDCLIASSAQVAGCTHTVTFDEGAAKAVGMRIVP